jgi:hypothetical protein
MMDTRPADARTVAPPPLPAGVAAQIADLRARMARTKLREAAFAALLVALVSLGLVVALDRALDTPPLVRAVLLGAALLVAALALPRAYYRWVYWFRSPLAVALRAAAVDPDAGERLLGVYELCTNGEEFARSPELTRAAIDAAAVALAPVDLAHIAPRSRHRGLAALSIAAAAALVVTAFMMPGATASSFLRWLAPFGDHPRFTFTRVAPFERTFVVAQGEPTELAFALAPDTLDHPTEARLVPVGDDAARRRFPALRVPASVGQGEADSYRFALPGVITRTELALVVGDTRTPVTLEPVERPEVLSASASVTLPSYLELPLPETRDVRSGRVGVVRGSTLAITAEVSRALTHAKLVLGSGEATAPLPVALAGATFTSGPLQPEDGTTATFEWRDVHGLSGASPFVLGVTVRDDGAPTVLIEGLDPERVLLQDVATSFEVRASDDFGVRRMGLEFEQIAADTSGGRGEYTPAGERVLGLGSPDARQLAFETAMRPTEDGLAPGFVRVRAWAEDALPGRGRVRSVPVVVLVMTAEQHMQWLTRELARWHGDVQEVRDVEHALLSENEALLELSNAELDSGEARARMREQASRERANGKRLDKLVDAGRELLTDAARNSEFNANVLDEWAESMASLEQLAENRMPSVAEKLAAAAATPRSGAASPAPPSPSSPPSGKPGAEPSESDAPPQGRPSESEIADAAPPDAAKSDPPPAEGLQTPEDRESGFGAPPASNGTKPPGPPPSLTLVSTTVGPLAGEPAPTEEEPEADAEPPTPAREALAAAVEEQRALMEELQRLAGEIQAVLEALEGSTFVKRLKALSRQESDVALTLDGVVRAEFGAPSKKRDGAPSHAPAIQRAQQKAAEEAANVRDDLAAFVERLRAKGGDFGKYETVHQEMGDYGVAREMGAIDALAAVRRSGEAIVSAEGLADTLDRWAEQIVGPG